MMTGKPHTQINIWINNDDMSAAIQTDFGSVDEIIDFLKDFIGKMDTPSYREYLQKVCDAQIELRKQRKIERDKNETTGET